jgi:formiminotetrahydrofolate cyclodeaminase
MVNARFEFVTKWISRLTPTPTGLSTGAIVGLSVLGIAVVGTILYFSLRKKQ